MIYEYYYEPSSLNFHKLSKEKLFFGIEIEMEANRDNYNYEERDETIQEFSDFIDEQYGKYWYCKTDGSLECGLEVVSHPFSFEYYTKYKNEFIQPILNEAILKEFDSYNTITCGQHIHITNRFNTFHLYKLLHFVHKNKEFIDGISQRKNKLDFERWCRLGIADKLVKDQAKDKCSGKYFAVRIKGKTVEIRIFKGTLKYESVCKNIEFCHALYMFTLDTKTNMLTEENFYIYTKNNKKIYPNLLNFLKKDRI